MDSVQIDFADTTPVPITIPGIAKTPSIAWATIPGYEAEECGDFLVTQLNLLSYVT